MKYGLVDEPNVVSSLEWFSAEDSSGPTCTIGRRNHAKTGMASAGHEDCQGHIQELTEVIDRKTANRPPIFS